MADVVAQPLYGIFVCRECDDPLQHIVTEDDEGGTTYSLDEDQEHTCYAFYADVLTGAICRRSPDPDNAP